MIDRCPICFAPVAPDVRCSCCDPVADVVRLYRVRIYPHGGASVEAVVGAPSSCAAAIRALELVFGSEADQPVGGFQLSVRPVPLDTPARPGQG